MAVKKSKNNFKIIGATMITLFSLVTVFTATIAWFSLNKKVDGSGMKALVTDGGTRLYKITFHHIEGFEYDDNGAIIKYSFARTEDAKMTFDEEGEIINNTLEHFPMGEYNPLSTEHPMLLLFELRTQYTTVSPGDICIMGKTPVTNFLGALQNGEPVYTLGQTSDVLIQKKNTAQGINYDYYALSSAINFKCKKYSTTEYTALLSGSLSDRIDIGYNDVTLNESFVNFTNNGTKIEFEQEPVIFEAPGDRTQIKYVAMVVNYDRNAISAIYSTFLGDSTLETTYGGELHFMCDWLLEVY